MVALVVVVIAVVVLSIAFERDWAIFVQAMKSNVILKSIYFRGSYWLEIVKVVMAIHFSMNHSYFYAAIKVSNVYLFSQFCP